MDIKTEKQNMKVAQHGENAEASAFRVTKKEYTIDAEGKRLGRVATEAAAVLLGKNSPDFTKHQVAAVTVTISNASKLDISEKRGTEIFKTYSGYPGGQRTETLAHLGKRRGFGEVVSRVIAGMLPKNKLHKLRMQNLHVTE
jgi:large subunit ribosomal protein L13